MQKSKKTLKGDNISSVMTVRRPENGIKYIHFNDKGCNEKKKSEKLICFRSLHDLVLHQLSIPIM